MKRNILTVINKLRPMKVAATMIKSLNLWIKSLLYSLIIRKTKIYMRWQLNQSVIRFWHNPSVRVAVIFLIDREMEDVCLSQSQVWNKLRRKAQLRKKRIKDVFWWRSLRNCFRHFQLWIFTILIIKLHVIV